MRSGRRKGTIHLLQSISETTKRIACEWSSDFSDGGDFRRWLRLWVDHMSAFIHTLQFHAVPARPMEEQVGNVPHGGRG